MNQNRVPASDDPHEAQGGDQQSGQSDDPRVDPTPDRRHSDGPPTSPNSNALGVVDPTADDGP